MRVKLDVWGWFVGVKSPVAQRYFCPEAWDPCSDRAVLMLQQYIDYERDRASVQR